MALNFLKNIQANKPLKLNLLTRRNDVFKLACSFCDDIYNFQKELPISFAVKDSLAPDRTYSVKRFVYHNPEEKEISCLYTANLGTYNYAFIVWKGTNSIPQFEIDLGTPFENQQKWREQLVKVTSNFIPRIFPYMNKNNMLPSNYEWFVAGHSLGGALAAVTGDMLRLKPSLIANEPVQNVITFASMKLPDPVLENDRNYADNNNVIEFYSAEDPLIEVFRPPNTKHIGHPRINVGYSLKAAPYPHSILNFQHYLNQNTVKI
jgi:hypothetical protein